MVDRRAFLTGSVYTAAAVAAWPARGAPSARGATRTEMPDASLVLVDRSLAGNDAIAADARARGFRVVEFSGDVAGAWMRELEPRLRVGPVSIAGYTSAATLFCLDFLARDYGARAVRRAEHGEVVSFVIFQLPGQRAALAPASLRASWRHSHA